MSNAKACKKWYDANPERGRAKSARWREENPEKVRAHSLKQYTTKRAYALAQAAQSRAKKKQIPFDLLGYVSHYQLIIDAGVCQLTGLPFSKEHGSAFAPSFDRIKPELGYVYGNVRVILFAVNMALGKWGEDTYFKIAHAYVARFPWER